jgi:signal transduction histidine kinase
VLEAHWQVTAVADGAAALAEIRRSPPDVVVTDVMMPGLDGFGLIAAVRADEATRALPVIVVSARAGDESRADGIERGADDYLIKPFSARELVARVGAQVGLVVARRDRDQMLEFNEKFTAILGHDLRNPLNAIATAAQLLERRATTPEIARPARRIVLSSERMTRMINQLLDLTRVRVVGGMRLDPKTLDLGELCQLVVAELRQDNPETNIELSTLGSLMGQWDRVRLAQVLANVAGNAVDHGEPTAPIRVLIDGSQETRVEIRVKNRGVIPEDAMASLFDPFRGVNHRRDNTRGLGLGLYITREIVAAHRGTIAVKSNREDGTCFAIDLPKRGEV